MKILHKPVEPESLLTTNRYRLRDPVHFGIRRVHLLGVAAQTLLPELPAHPRLLPSEVDGERLPGDADDRSSRVSRRPIQAELDAIRNKLQQGRHLAAGACCRQVRLRPVKVDACQGSTDS